jgi:mono/diheme cytochrome c family protein
MRRKRWNSRSNAGLYSLPVLLILVALIFITLGASSKKVLALPEYSIRTGESCAACHVNPGGGGPRTLRGLLWSARGRPDEVPELPGMLIAPRVSEDVELYEIACGGCHGYRAEGLSAMGLANTHISQRSIESFTLSGIPRLGMPGFEDQFTDDQLEKLMIYMSGISNGDIAPPEDKFQLPPALFRCENAASDPICGAPAREAGGN